MGVRLRCCLVGPWPRWGCAVRVHCAGGSHRAPQRPAGDMRHGVLPLFVAPAGRGSMRFCCLYLALGYGAEARACAAAWACVVDAQCTAEVPSVVLGDFNVELRDQPLEAVRRQRGWEYPLPHTAISSAAARPKRIERVLLRRAARLCGAVNSIRKDLGLPTHGAHIVDWSDGPAVEVPVWRAPQAPPEPMREVPAQHVEGWLRPFWAAACEDRVEDVWDILERAAARFHAAAAGCASARAPAQRCWESPMRRAKREVHVALRELKGPPPHRSPLSAVAGPGPDWGAARRFVAIACGVGGPGSPWAARLGLPTAWDQLVALLQEAHGARRAAPSGASRAL